MNQHEQLATPRQVAVWLQCSERTLRRRRQDRTGPPWIVQNGRIRYSWLDVHRWAASNRVRPDHG